VYTERDTEELLNQCFKRQPAAGRVKRLKEQEKLGETKRKKVKQDKSGKKVIGGCQLPREGRKVRCFIINHASSPLQTHHLSSNLTQRLLWNISLLLG